MTQELRERVARALYEHWWSVTKAGPTWETVNDDWRNGVLGQADAAIALVLEEAATMYWIHRDGKAEDIHAAIRALKEGT